MQECNLVLHLYWSSQRHAPGTRTNPVMDAFVSKEKKVTYPGHCWVVCKEMFYNSNSVTGSLLVFTLLQGRNEVCGIRAQSPRIRDHCRGIRDHCRGIRNPNARTGIKAIFGKSKHNSMVIVTSAKECVKQLIWFVTILSTTVLQLEVEQRGRTTLTRMKTYDVSHWTTAEEVDLGHLVSLTVDHSPQTQPMNSDLKFCALSFHKSTGIKVSDFTFNTEVQKWKQRWSFSSNTPPDQPLCLLHANEGKSL